MPGTFEHALHHLLTRSLDLSHFDARFRNDATGAPAYPPATLFQIVVFAYSRGIVGSRPIARACDEHVTFIALCGDQAPHFTTIAQFVSTLGEDIARVFAIDGVKLPSNASKQRSGTRAGFARQATKLEAAARRMLQRHRAADALPVEPDLAAKADARIARLEHEAAQIRDWLATHPTDRPGATLMSAGLRPKATTSSRSPSQPASYQDRAGSIRAGLSKGRWSLPTAIRTSSVVALMACSTLLGTR